MRSHEDIIDTYRTIVDAIVAGNSSAFYSTTLFWQWMRLPGDVLFAIGALLMAWDFIVKLRPQAIDRLIFRTAEPLQLGSEPSE